MASHSQTPDSTTAATLPTPSPPPPSPPHLHLHRYPTSFSMSTSSKLPFRPRKIRKLSATTPPPPKPTTTIIHLPRNLSCEGEIDLALAHMKSTDPLLAPLIDHHLPPTFNSFHSPFPSLAKSILYQQLATKAATSIYNKFTTLCGGATAVTPSTLLSLTPHQLRQVGVSARKASYLHDLANKYQTGILSDSSILKMDDNSLFTMLTMVKGIAPWSVHMFLIFSLRRPDVLPVGDLGVRKGVQLLYGLKELPKPSQMEQLCEKWRPYRSVGSWYMWRMAEAKGEGVAVVVIPTREQEA